MEIERARQDRVSFLMELTKAEREQRIVSFEGLTYIKELLPKRRLTGKELGILNITDLCQRITQERKGLEIVPLFSDSKFKLLRRRVDEVAQYKQDYEEYKKAYEILYIQEQWARSIYRSLLLKIMGLEKTLELVEVAETHTQKLKKNKGPLDAYDKDLEHTQYTLKNIVDDRPEAALPYASRVSLKQIVKDIYFLYGFNQYVNRLGEKLGVIALNALRFNTKAFTQRADSYNYQVKCFTRYLIKNGRSKEELEILEDIFPYIGYEVKNEKMNIKAVLTAEQIIEKHDIFTEGYANPVFYLFTDNEAGHSL